MHIIVIGSPGSGKSTFSKKIAEKLNYPILHLDNLWHKTDYSSKARAWLAQEQVDFFLAHDNAIIDGNYSGTLKTRLAYCDLVIYLHVSPITALFRVVQRSIKTRFFKEKRSDMADNFQEKFDKEYLEFLSFVWHFKKNSKPNIDNILKDYLPKNCQVINLHRKKEKELFLEKLKRD